MNNNFEAARDMLNEYVQDLAIDVFMVPVQFGRNCGAVVCDAKEVLAHSMQLVDDGVLFLRRGEQYFRLRERYSATWLLPRLSDVAIGRVTFVDVRRLDDIPPHCGMWARGFERTAIIKAGGNHTGDNIGAADGVTRWGITECKAGNGCFISTAKRPEKGANNDE